MIQSDNQRKKTTEDEAIRIRDALREFSSDEYRGSISDLLLSTGKSISANQVASWMMVFYTDEYRLKMLRKLSSLIEDPENLDLYGKCLKYDSSRKILYQLAYTPRDDKTNLDSVWTSVEKKGEVKPSWSLSNLQFVMLFTVVFLLGAWSQRFF